MMQSGSPGVYISFYRDPWMRAAQSSLEDHEIREHRPEGIGESIARQNMGAALWESKYGALGVSRIRGPCFPSKSLDILARPNFRVTSRPVGYQKQGTHPYI